MGRKPINQVVAEALRFYMGDRWNNTTLGKAAGVAPNTVKNCLSPDERQPGKSGKAPSVKLTELELLADALGVQVADLVTDATDAERLLTHRKRASEFYQRHGVLPPWAPGANPADPAPQTKLRDAA